MIENEKQGVEYFNQRSLKGSMSGWGSVGAWAKLKRDMLWKVWPFESMLDIGCGDMIYLSSFGPFVSNEFCYLGVDGSADIIRRARKRRPDHNFRKLMISDLIKTDLNQNYEVIVCYDVLFHIVEDGLYTKLMDWLFNSSAKALALTYLKVAEEGPRKGHFILRDFGKVSIPDTWELEMEGDIGRKKRQKVAVFVRETMDKN